MYFTTIKNVWPNLKLYLFPYDLSCINSHIYYWGFCKHKLGFLLTGLTYRSLNPVMGMEAPKGDINGS